MREVTIFWTCSKTDRDNVKKAFGLPEHTSLNGETTARVSEDVYKRLLSGQDKGYLKLRNK